MKKIITLLLFQCSLFIVFAQVPNGDFESWVIDIDSNVNPVSWETNNAMPSISVQQYSPACSGNFALLAKAFNVSGFTFAGIASTTFAFNQRPAQLTACVKATIMPGDVAYIMFSSHRGDANVEPDSIVAAADSCTFKFLATTNQYQCFTMNLAYQSSALPDAATILIAAGSLSNPQVGTQIIVDKISFTACPTGIDEGVSQAPAILGKSYPNPAGQTLFIPITLSQSSNLMLTVYNVIGEEVKQLPNKLMSAGNHSIELPINDLSNGIYTYAVKGDDFTLSGKFVVSK